MTYNQIIFLAVVALTLFMSLVSLVIYKKDKQLAIDGKPRIKEKTLLSVSALFGALGAFFARILFRHKTDKKYFSVVILFSLLLQVLLLVYLFYLAFIF